MSLSNTISKSLYTLARHVRIAGFKKEANRIMKLSRQSQVVVDVLKKVFSPAMGDFLGEERARNLSMAVLYYQEGDDLLTYIHDALMKTNESYYDAERKHKLPDKKAWDLAEKAVSLLQKKRVLPKELS